MPAVKNPTASHIMKIKNTLFVLLLLSSPLLLANEPALVVIYDDSERHYSLSELVQHKDMTDISLEKDPVYPGHKLIYQAIPLTSFFHDASVAEEAIVGFTTEDGYNSLVAGNRLLNDDSRLPVAYLAIENPNKKWPLLAKHNRSAGPFLLIWRHTDPGAVDGYPWPYWIRKIEVKDHLEALYPAIFPKSEKYEKGFQLFLKNCFSCHTLNKQGSATLGPDLNYPHSPTEYFQDTYLRKLIREPSSLRHWPNSRMGSFNESRLSTKELNALLEYLRHMSKNKVN